MSTLSIPTQSDELSELGDIVQQLPIISPNRINRASWRNNTSNNSLLSPSSMNTLRSSPTNTLPTPPQQSIQHSSYDHTLYNYDNKNNNSNKRQLRRNTAPVNGFAEMLQNELRDAGAAAGNIETPTGMPFQHPTYHHTIQYHNQQIIKLDSINNQSMKSIIRRSSIISPTRQESNTVTSEVNGIKQQLRYNYIHHTLVQQCCNNTITQQYIKSILTSGLLINLCIESSTQQNKNVQYKYMKCWFDDELNSLYYTVSIESMLSRLSLSSSGTTHCNRLLIGDVISFTTQQPCIVQLIDKQNTLYWFQFDHNIQYNEFIFYIEYCMYTVQHKIQHTKNIDATQLNRQQSTYQQTTIQCLSQLVTQHHSSQLQHTQSTCDPSIDLSSRVRLPSNKEYSDKIQLYEYELERCYNDHSNLLNQERKYIQPLMDQLHDLTVENTWLKSQLKQTTPRSTARNSGGNLSTNITGKFASPRSIDAQQLYVA